MLAAVLLCPPNTPSRLLPPAVQHVFANNGYGGAFLQSYLLSGCPEATIPDPVDLVILENLGGESLPNRIEQVGGRAGPCSFLSNLLSGPARGLCGHTAWV